MQPAHLQHYVMPGHLAFERSKRKVGKHDLLFCKCYGLKLQKMHLQEKKLSSIPKTRKAHGKMAGASPQTAWLREKRSWLSGTSHE